VGLKRAFQATEGLGPGLDSYGLRWNSVGALVNPETNGHVQLKTGNSCIAELLLASKDGLCHMEPVSTNLHSSDDRL
jgi:hypothetical protein